MRQDSPFVVFTLSFLVLAAFTLVMRVAQGGHWGLCECSRCTLQDWLSATSGWAAVIAALLGSALVLGQLSEQRRQTAFMVGDAEPTMELSQPAKADTPISFQLVNWNRRKVVLHRIRLHPSRWENPPPQPTAINFLTSTKASAEWDFCSLDVDGYTIAGIGLLGWIDRQNKPPVCQIEIVFPDGAFNDFPRDYQSKYIFEFLMAQDDAEGMPREFLLKVPVVSAFLWK